MEGLQGCEESREYSYETKIKTVVHSDYLKVKRFFDIIISLLLMIITLPVVIVFSILICLETPGKPFYSQERVGLNGKRFKVLKLRSMYNDAEKDGAVWAAKNDARVTKIGKFIRKTRIDELPQLWLVLKGDMSLIGPRPERPEFTEQFSQEIPGFEQRLRILPGLSGYAQVHGGYDITPKEKLKYDLYYIENISFKLDFEILLDTIKVVCNGEGAR